MVRKLLKSGRKHESSGDLTKESSFPQNSKFFLPKIFVPPTLDILFITLISSFKQKLKTPQADEDNGNFKKQVRRSPK